MENNQRGIVKQKMCGNSGNPKLNTSQENDDTV